MDTEYDKSALKAIIFATRSRKEVEALGIKADRAVQFLQNSCQAADECENALIAAEDILELRLQKKKEVIEEKIHQIDEKVTKLGDLLPKFRRDDLETEKDMLKERAARVTNLQAKQESSSKKRFQQCKRKLATQLIEENRIKRRKTCSGAPRLMDSDDEEYIKRAIEEKSTAHGRRHDAVLYTNKRVKKKDFLSIANYHLYRKGKKLIKRATTVLNRGRPRNKSSRAAKAHLGKWLFCSKKPPKTEHISNECTHHQRKHVKNAKLSIFEKGREEKGLVISMDDKAYLRPGTDVGMRNVKTGKIYDVADEEKQRKLPQHDFSIPQVHITPSSFRFMDGHQEMIDGKTHVVNDLDQTVVTNRPKHYIGSSGSVWASDTMFMRSELPQLFEVQDSQYRTCSLQLRRFCAHVHDCVFYFEDTTMHEDVMACTEGLNCKFREYEISRLSWLERQLKGALLRWEEDKLGVEGEDVALGNEVKDTAKVVLDTLQQREEDIRGSSNENLWEIYVDLLNKVRKIQQCISELHLPQVRSDVLYNTDAGPGVGCSNIEVKFRDAEVARILNFDRLNRIHRARDDSGQNEAERSNACIGEAIVDGEALKWKYYEALDELENDEIKQLSIDDINKLEENAMERNAWRVAKDVTERIQGEPGPGGDFIQAFVTPRKEDQFFFNTEQLKQFVSTAESKQEGVPGYAYFKKIDAFIEQHVQVGELYLEYMKGDCQQNSGVLCEFCTKFPPSKDSLHHVPRPMPDETTLPDLKYLPFDQTPSTSPEGRPREIDDYQPRAQIKRHVEEGKLALDDSESIVEFSKTFAVPETYVRKYLEHLQYLAVKKSKRKDERKRQRETEAQKKYADYKWEELFIAGKLKKLKVPALNLFLEKHQLGKKKMTKKEKLVIISACLAKAQLDKAIGEQTARKVNAEENVDFHDDDEETEDDDDDDDDDSDHADDEDDDYNIGSDNKDCDGSSEDYDVVLQEIGSSSEDDTEDERVNDDIEVELCSRVGRRVTTFQSRRFFGDSD